jgi:NAD(P) transhydrogenase subunit beta
MSNTHTLLYLLAAVFFILALKGLSSPESARRGNAYGIAGMVIAIITSLFLPSVSNYGLILFGIMIGGIIGTSIARKIPMTAMPQLVAAFHSLVGMAAVLIAMGALWSPESYGIGNSGHIHFGSLMEMGLGAAIGAITFSGSVIAFAKLQGLMSGKPIRFVSQHLLNAALAAAILFLLLVFCFSEAKSVFILFVLLSFALGFLLIIPIGGADMPVVVSMLNSYSGWFHARKSTPHHHRRTGWCVGCNSILHHV